MLSRFRIIFPEFNFMTSVGLANSMNRAAKRGSEAHSRGHPHLTQAMTGTGASGDVRAALSMEQLCDRHPRFTRRML